MPPNRMQSHFEKFAFSILRFWGAGFTVLAVLIVVIISAILVSNSTHAFTGNGSGSQGDPFEITTCAQLQEMENDLSAYYIQINNIDCNGFSWTPIGISGTTDGSGFPGLAGTTGFFTGEFDGDDYTISNVTITASGAATGFFGRTQDATLKNINLINIQITKGADYSSSIGALVGVNEGGTISNCSTSGTIAQTSSDGGEETDGAGGLVGYARGDAHITNSSAAVDISLNANVYITGGFVGVARGTVLIEDSYATGFVHSGIDAYSTGGFIGWLAEDAEVYRSYATGEVHVGVDAPAGEGNNYDHGGFAGAIGAWINWNGYTAGLAKAEACYSTGNVISEGEDNYDTGGFVGTLYDGGTITKSYATGNVSNPGLYGNDIGGFVGLTRNRFQTIEPSISQSYSSGTVTIGSGEMWGIGGFVGEHRNGSITDSYTRSAVHVTTSVQDSWGDGIGGFVGEYRTQTSPPQYWNSATMTNTYAAGEMVINTFDYVTEDVGGLVGYLYGLGGVTSSYWDVDVSGTGTSVAGSGLSTSAMKSEGSFSGWDFSNIWNIQPGFNDGYPAFIFWAPTPTPTPTPTATPTDTPTDSPTDTPTDTPTDVPTDTPTETGTVTPTSTGTSTATPTGTGTGTSTPTGSNTATPSVSTTTTSSGTPTTPIPFTATPTILATLPPITSGNTDTNQQNTCPIFTTFRVSSTVVEPGNKVTFSWITTNATRVIWSGYEKNLPSSGSRTITPEETMEIKLLAINGGCSAKVSEIVSVVETVPWTNSTAIGAGALVVEAAIIQLTSFYAIAAKGGSAALQQSSVQGNIWLALAGFLDKKKRRSFGIVYDSVNKKPIARAVVRLLMQKNNKVVDTVVTDAKGVMRLAAHPGEYYVKVSHPQYKFPSTLISGNTDGGYAQVYVGGPFTVEKSTQPIMMSIPVDPIELSLLQRKKVQAVAVIEKVGNYGSSGILTFGFLYSVYAAYIYPHLFNYLAVLLYVVILGAKLVLVFMKPRSTGKVLTLEGKPVAGVELGLFDVEFKNLLYRTFTTNEGTYNFAVGNGSYYLKIMDERFSINQSGKSIKAMYIEPAGSKDNVRLITENITVNSL